MLRGLKINTALVICAAFFFRLLFVNIGIVSSLNTHQNKGVVKAHFSSLMKKRRTVEAPNSSGNYEYSAIEICEEGADENNFSKSNPFLFTQVLYSPVAGKISNTLQKVKIFQGLFSYSPLPRYLKLEVFRI